MNVTGAAYDGAVFAKARIRLLLVVPVIAGLTVAAHAATQATPRWQTVPSGAIDHRAIAVAAGRMWVVDGPPTSGPVIARSARFAGGKLTGWKAARLPEADDWGFIATLGDDLIVETGREPGKDIPTLRALRMRSNGTLGDPVAVEGAPPPPSSLGAPVARLPDRVLQPADANPLTDRIEVGVCCDATGVVADYSSFIRWVSLGNPPLLGVDARGRLWLSWFYRSGKEPNTAWMVGLDPQTLVPRGAPQKVPGLRFAQTVSLVCSDVCRLVLVGASRTRSSKARAFAWAPGESSPTPLLPPLQLGSLVAAAHHEGHLVIAYTTQDSHGGLALAMARGDARGRKLRAGAKLAIPGYLGAFERGEGLTVGPLGAFGPGGFGAFTVYEASRKHSVRAVVLPVG